MALIVETGAVVTGADCYENAADTVARLELLNKFSLDAKDAPEQEAIIRLSTVDCEDELRPGIEGSLVADTQPRLYPLHDSMDITGREFDSDEIPEAIKLGIAYRCEDRAAGDVDDGLSVIEDEAPGRSTKYRESSGGSHFSRQSRQSWGQLKRLFWSG